MVAAVREKGGFVVEAKHGDRVLVHYTGKLRDGTVFDSSADGDPMVFTIGAGETIPGFEYAVIGMTPGEKKTTFIVADDAYGSWTEDRIVTVPRKDFPPSIIPEKGQILEMSHAEDQNILLKVIDVDETMVTLDANHPLAGEDLIFDIELISIT